MVAEVCENFSEYFLSEKTTEEILALAEDAVEKGAEVEIFCYAAWIKENNNKRFLSGSSESLA